MPHADGGHAAAPPSGGHDSGGSGGSGTTVAAPVRLNKQLVLRHLQATDDDAPGDVVAATRPTMARTLKLGERADFSNTDDTLRDFFVRMRESRTEESARQWGMIGAAGLLLAAVGSVGTFARVSRHSLASPASKALMARESTLQRQAADGLVSVSVLEREAEKAALRARITELKAKQQEKHPLWYPDASSS